MASLEQGWWDRLDSMRSRWRLPGGGYQPAILMFDKRRSSEATSVEFSVIRRHHYSARVPSYSSPFHPIVERGSTCDGSGARIEHTRTALLGGYVIRRTRAMLQLLRVRHFGGSHAKTNHPIGKTAVGCSLELQNPRYYSNEYRVASL